jgi:hypothetical protein
MDAYLPDQYENNSPEVKADAGDHRKSPVRRIITATITLLIR